MASENFKKAVRIISQRKQKAKLDAQLRRDEVYAKIPQIQELSRNLALTGSKLAKQFFSSDGNVSSAIESIKNENLSMQKMQTELLKKNGYPIDYLETKYFCAECEDTGYSDGIKCKCLRDLVTELNVSAFNQSANIAPSTFEQFSLDYYDDIDNPIPRKQMEQIYNFCKTYAVKFQSNSPNILMMGETGLGKTHLSLAIANVIMKNGYVAMYASSLDLFRTLQNEYFGKGEPEKNTMQTLLGADLVIIDDLGAEYESQFNTSTLYNIVNSRLNMNKPTIINTNCTLAELERRYTSRVASRLMTLFKCLKFMGKDVRQIKLKNNEI